MTTETTSLHDRLREYVFGHNVSDGGSLFIVVPLPDLATIEADMTVEAEAPLRERIREMEYRIVDLVAETEIQREEGREWDDENAALRTAGTEMRHQTKIVRDRLWSLTGNYEATDAAIKAWDAATMPRAKETQDGCRSLGVRDRDTDRNHPGDMGREEVAEGSAGVGRDDPAAQRGMGGDAAEPQAVAPSPTDASNDQVSVESCPTDAAGEPFAGPTPPPTWQERMDEWSANTSLELTAIAERIAALEQRADDARERLDELKRLRSSDVAGNTGLNNRHAQRIDDLEKRIAKQENVHPRLSYIEELLNRIERMEARTTPQPVAVTDEMAKVALSVWAPEAVSNPGLVALMQRAMQTALAKDGGK